MYPEPGFRGTAITTLLMTFACASIWAQTQDARQVFPSDAMRPAQAGGAELLEILCPGQVVNTPEVGCRTGCPKYTGFGIDGDVSTWSLRAVTRGHFLSPTSDDAALSMEGCEPHSENSVGTVLLTRRSGQWVMLWYKAGVEASRCHKVQLQDARDILVCMDSYGGQGTVVTDLYVEDLLTPTGSVMADERTQSVFSATDTTLTCGLYGDDPRKPLPVVRSRIDKVEFSTGKAHGQSIMVVTASLGRKNMTTADAEACLKTQDGTLPETTSYRLEFVFDGHQYNVSPSSAEAFRLFETW